MGARQLLVIEDNPGHLRLWKERIEEQGWDCVQLLATTVEEVLEGIDRRLADPAVSFDATILDVMFGRQGEYDGIEAFREADASYEGRFGYVVVASGKEWGDEQICQFIKDYDAIRCASPLSHNATDVMRTLREKFKDPPI